MNDDIFKLSIKGDTENLVKLLNNSSNKDGLINAKSGDIEYTPLIFAVLQERIETVRLLLEFGADPNLQDAYGKTALHLLPEKQPIEWTSINNKIKIAQLLIQNGADINKLDCEGAPPLFYATFYIKKEEDLKLLEFYLQNGANPNKKSDKGESSLEFAKRINSQIRIDLLEKYNK